MTAPARLSWRAVRDRLHARILDGQYAAGDKLPKDEDLASELGCARSTVQRAMQDLADSGLIERRRKGGTHVRLNPVTRATFEIPLARQEVEARGARYDYRLIEAQRRTAPRPVARDCGLRAPQEMLHVRALHLADDRPFIYEDRWISLRTVPEIAEVDLARHSANEWLVRNRPYDRCDLRFFAIKAGQTDADLLDTQPGEALFVMARTTWIAEAPITTVRAVTAPGYQLLTRI